MKRYICKQEINKSWERVVIKNTKGVRGKAQKLFGSRISMYYQTTI